MTIYCPNCLKKISVSLSLKKGKRHYPINGEFTCNSCGKRFKLSIREISEYTCACCGKKFKSTEPNLDNSEHYCQDCMY